MMTREFGFSIIDKFNFYFKGRRIVAPITDFKQVLQHPKYPHLVAALNYTGVLTIYNALLSNPEKYHYQKYPDTTTECVDHIKWAETKPYLLMWCSSNFVDRYLSVLDCSDELAPSRSNSTFHLDYYSYQFIPITHTGEFIEIGIHSYPCPIEQERMEKISQLLEKRIIKITLTKYMVADLANITIQLA